MIRVYGKSNFKPASLNHLRGWNQGFSGQLPSGKHTKNYKTITIFHGQIHYFYGHVQ